jgi:hypothetical protein
MQLASKNSFSKQYDLVECLIFSKLNVHSMLKENTHGLADTIEKWAKRLGINLDRDPEQIP